MENELTPPSRLETTSKMMLNRKTNYSMILISICLAIGCGLLDRETASLWHLLTADTGNLVALPIYALTFAIVGFLVIHLVNLANSRSS